MVTQKKVATSILFNSSAPFPCSKNTVVSI